MDVAAIGRAHLREALTGTKNHCDVTDWLDESGQPVKIYWLPVTGAQQIKIDAFKTEVERQAMTVKVRALNEDGSLMFKDTPIESLINDYDMDVIKAIAYLIVTNYGQEQPQTIDEKVEQQAKE